MKCLIITVGYKEYAVELTTEVAAAIPVLLSSKKVKYACKNEFTLLEDKSDLQFTIADVEGEAENGNN